MKISNNTRTGSFGLIFSVVGLLIFLIISGVLNPKHSPDLTQAGLSTPAAAISLDSAPNKSPRPDRDYGNLPMSFESNQGQTDPTVNFLTRGQGYALFLAPTEATFVLTNQGVNADQRRLDGAVTGGDRVSSASGRTTVLRMKVAGGNAHAKTEGLQELAGKVNYYIGNDPSRWRTNIPTFERVRYNDVYPGIDVTYYGNQQQLEYDFVVSPGTDHRQVALEFDGKHKLEIETSTGDLLISVDQQTIRQHKPSVYQELAGERREIQSQYALRSDGRIGFEIGEYDHRHPLVIDPVLVYSTYLGGTDIDNGSGIAVDSSGNAYITGSTSSTNFPTSSPIQVANAGNDDVVVTKINATGSALIYSTYLGGSGFDTGSGIALDSSGNAYIVGTTTSTNFPTANPIQPALAGPFGSQFRGDAFVTKINAAGTALVYSTYLGGSDDPAAETPGGTDVGSGIAVDAAGNAYVTGTTSSRHFPTTAGAFQPTGSVDAFNDAFVTKINPAGSAFVYSSYLGGSSNESGGDIAVDSSGNAYVVGQTLSSNFPTANPLQPAYGGGNTGGTFGDAFLTKVNPGGSSLVYSTYLGGSSSDGANGVKVDASGNAYIVGGTSSTNFPTLNPIQASNNGPEDIFVAKVNSAGSALVYSTYLGGSGRDFSADIAIDSSGNAFITGNTASTNFPSANPIQITNAGSDDVFLTKLNAAGSALVYSTYLGGTANDSGKGIAVDSANDVYLTGTTNSTCFPTTTGALDNTADGTSFFVNVFVSKISETAAAGTIFACTPTPTPTPTPSPTASPSPTPSPGASPTPSGSCVAPPSGLIAWYAGEGDTKDIAGPTFENASPGAGTSFVAGKVGQAFLVDSADDAVTSASLNIGSNYTVDLWIRPATSNTADFLRVLGNTLNFTNFGTMYLVQNRIEYYQNGSNSLRVSSPTGSVPFNTYTHVAMTYDGSVNRLYINGNLVGTSASHTEVYNNAVRIGNAFDPTGNSFNGQLDEVEIFNRVLSQSEISSIVAADTFGKCKPVIPTPTPTPPLSPNPSPTPVPSPAISCAADLTFGISGRTNTDFPGGIDRATAVAVQSDGKIVVAGAAGSDFAVARLNPDGSMDTSFGSGGRVYTDFFLSFDAAETMLIQPDGKIVVAGSTYVGDFKDFALARYNSDGSLDSSFGIGGKVTTDFNKAEDVAYGIALQSDGKIVAAGGTGGASLGSTDFGLARYNTNGSLDTTFGEGGRLVTDMGNDSEQANAVAIQTDGKIVVTGYTVINNIDSNFALARFNTNGTLDTSFDVDGKLTTDFGSTDTAQAVAIQTDGKIVAAGRGAGGAGGLSGFAVARYNTNGGLDTTFDGDGKITISTSGNVDTAEAVVIQPDGKIVAAGWGGGGSSGLDFVAIRYNTNGSPDTTFDGDGKAMTAFFNGDFAYAAALQTDGKIVIAGTISTGSVSGTPGAGTSSDFALLRYNTNGTLDTSFDGDGKVSLELFYLDERITSLAQQSTGKIVAAGGYGGLVFIFDIQNHNFQLARYNTNGQLDTTFGTAGRVSTDFNNGSIDVPNAIAVLPDDRIVLAGFSRPEISGLSDLILARYTPDGALDPTFDGDGKVITDFSSGSDGANTMVIQPDGKILVGGFAGSASALVRYNANGQLDNTFGTGGRAVVTPSFSILSIALQPDGKIVAAGSTGGSGSDFVVARFNSNGSPDDGAGGDSTPGDSFGTNGRVTTDFTGPSGFDFPSAVRIQTDGKIVVAGDISIVRYNTNGSLDLSFDGDGKATSNVSISALALQADGKILASGTTGGSVFVGSSANRDFALVRYNLDGTLDTLCSGSSVTTDFFGVEDRALAMIVQPDNKVVLGGYTSNGGSEDFAIARYNIFTPTPDVSVSVSPLSTAEDGATNLVYTFTRSGSITAPLTVNFSVGGTATLNTDYSQNGAAGFTSSAGTVTIGAGNSSATVTIDPTADITVEPNETVILTVTSGTGYNVGNPSSATGTITNDDATPGLSINDVQVAEGNSGTTNAVFTVTLSTPSSLTVTVNFATADGTATQPGDYQSTSGVLTFNPGDVSKPITVPVNGDIPNEASETFLVNLSNSVNANITDNQGVGTILNDDTPVLNFSLVNYTVSESGGQAQITVNRTGDPASAVTVDYMTTDNSNPADFILCSSNPAGTASSRCDFNTALGTLRLAAGETTKTFNVLITQDSYVEGTETLQLTLSNPTGSAALGAQSASTLQILDDVPETTTNPILDARNFVRQQYHDFLNREPDQPGWDYWTDNITRCNDPARRPAGQTVDQCIDRQRETTSAAFFLSPEFQYTGLYVYSVYKGSLGRMPNFVELMRDVQQVSRGIVINNVISGATIEQNRAQFETEFIQRAEFLGIYGALDNQGYVDKLFQTTGTSVTAADKQALVNGLNGLTETRASVLHKVVNGTRVIAEGQVDVIAAYGKTFTDSQFTPAFVQMEYLGYLRRNSDAPGFIFWRDKMNSFSGDFLKAEMVKSFLMSPEYLQRFAAP